MSKDPNFIGQPILSQILNFIDKRKVDKIAYSLQSDRYTKKFTTYDHLVTMLYCILSKCNSLREVTTGMQACFTKLNHLGMTYCPRRSTLSDANKRRSSEVFEHIYRYLYDLYAASLSDSQIKKSNFLSKLYIVDACTISLFKDILKCAGRPMMNGKRKGGIKVHTLIKANEDVPCLVKLTAAAKHDVSFIKKMNLPPGSIIALDKGYKSYDQFNLWSNEGVFWVTRLVGKSKWEVIDDIPLTDEQRKQGIISDQIVTLGNNHKNITRLHARLVVYYDHQQDRIFYFITNNEMLEASSIALIYKHRWQIELLFKRIKQNYPIQYFLGDNENAIKVQVWCALIADLLVKLIKTRVKRKWSHANIVSMVRLHLMSYFKLLSFLENPDKVLINKIPKPAQIPNLFNTS